MSGLKLVPVEINSEYTGKGALGQKRPSTISIYWYRLVVLIELT